jgi:hypothetical protein
MQSANHEKEEDGESARFPPNVVVVAVAGPRECNSGNAIRNTTTILTLGDGDFSFSLDLVRYLVGTGAEEWFAPPFVRSTDKKEEDITTTQTNHHPQRHHGPLPKTIRVVATGIDSHHEVLKKYRDAPFLLRELEAHHNATITNTAATNNNNEQKDGTDQSGTTTRTMLEIQIHHGINAIATFDPNVVAPPLMEQQHVLMPAAVVAAVVDLAASDHVIFNHPHLGTEDAVLHSQFLYHLLHSANRCWMKPCGGIFHLTLVHGQYERWNCQNAAQRNGLVLLEQNKFRPPPPPLSPSVTPASDGTNNNNISVGSNKHKDTGSTTERRTFYQYRRHQTGKSFETRRALGQSQTYTFGRASDEGWYVATCLPWQHGVPTLPAGNDEDDNNDCDPQPQAQLVRGLHLDDNVDKGAFSCLYCARTFHEERSRKCHVLNKHPDQAVPSQKSRKRNRPDGRQQNQQQHQHDNSQLQVEKKTSDAEVFPCPFCLLHTVPGGGGAAAAAVPRMFESAQALQDHLRAKHHGQHHHILPDWHSTNKGGNGLDGAIALRNTDTKQEVNGLEKVGILFGTCSICGLQYRSPSETQEHHLHFIPSSSSNCAKEFQCSHCSKSFRENRARLQHENFCALQSFTSNT